MKSFPFPRRSPIPPLCSDQGSVMMMMMMMFFNKMMMMIMRMRMMMANLVGDIV